MTLGIARTSKATIGSFELRVGPLTEAGRLEQKHSVGIVDQVKLDIQLDSVDLLAGFPQKPSDTAITRYVTGISATLRETSLRNLNLLLGNALTDFSSTKEQLTNLPKIDTWNGNIPARHNTSPVTVQLTRKTSAQYKIDTDAGGPEFSTTTGSNNVIIYKASDKSVFALAKLTGIANVDTVSTDLNANNVTIGLTLDHLSLDLEAGETYYIAKVNTVAGGATDGTPKYFSAQLVRIDRSSGAPIGIDFWKTTISAGLSLSSTVSDFASYEMQLKALEPSAVDIASGGGLFHAAALIAENPVFRMFDVPDV